MIEIFKNIFKNCLTQYGNQFVGTNQHDLQEFLSCFLTALDTELNEIGFKIIQELFFGVTFISYTCQQCHCTSQTSDPFSILNLQVPSKQSSMTIEQCLDLYGDEEELNEWPCENNCKATTKHKMRIIFDKLPNILLVRVKISNNSNETQIKFKEMLRIKHVKFELIGVVCHRNVLSRKF